MTRRLPGPRFRRARDRARAELAGAASAQAASTGLPPTVADPSAAAFFDVDNTMIVGSSIYHIARGLAARNYFTTRDLVRFGWHQTRFRVFGQETAASLSTARDSALAFVAGRRVADIVQQGEEIYDEVLAARIYPGARALAQRHLDAGQRVWLVTAAPVELAELIADRLGLTGALGTVAQSVDGVYTGLLVGEPLHGAAKAVAVRALADREGLDLARCAAYSDSANDLPMLCLVGHPVAVNPDPDLRAYARAHGWPVRDFRTGRRAARIGIPAAGGAGLVAGAVVAGMGVRRRRGGRPAGPVVGHQPKADRLAASSR